VHSNPRSDLHLQRSGAVQLLFGCVRERRRHVRPVTRLIPGHWRRRLHAVLCRRRRLVTNGSEEVWPRILATCSDSKGKRDQTGRLIEHSRDTDVVTRGDRGKEHEQGIVGVIRSPNWFHHRDRLSYLGSGRSEQGSYHVDNSSTRALEGCDPFPVLGDGQ
jgi:hypothetical protein